MSTVAKKIINKLKISPSELSFWKSHYTDKKTDSVYFIKMFNTDEFSLKIGEVYIKTQMEIMDELFGNIESKKFKYYTYLEKELVLLQNYKKFENIKNI